MTREEAEIYAKTMTYEDALYNLSRARAIPYRKATFIKVNELIKALSQEPTFDDECQKDMDEAWKQIQKKRKRIPVTLDLTPCNDAISREAVMGLVAREHTEWDDLYIDIAKLPSVTQKSGKWILGINWKCNKCGFVDSGAHGFNYCPNCGAKMESGDKE